MFDEKFCLFQKMDSFTFYGKPMNRAHDTSDDESENLEDSDYQVGSSESDSDTHAEMNTTQDDEDTSEAEEQTNQSPEPAQNDWANNVIATSRIYSFTGKEEVMIRPANTDKVWPIDMFELFVTDQVLDFIVQKTNRFASQELASKTMTRNSRLSKWSATDKAEMKKFLGIIILMGIKPLPEISLYWSKSMLYKSELIPDSMDRDRFQILMRMLHFSDNTEPDTTRLRKVQKLVDLLLVNFQKTYSPGSDLVVDESMVPFRGRVKFRQYIPGKSHKYGCKLFKICTPDGYTWNLEVYSGTSVSENSMGLSDSVVVRLARDLLDKGSTIFMDNYYTSIPLATFLLSRKTYMCGTARANRKHLPKSVTQKKLKRGEMSSAVRKEIKVFNWKDKRNVITVSPVPEHDDCLVATGKKTRQGEDEMKPKKCTSLQ